MYTTAKTMSTRNFKSLNETSTIKGRLHRSLIYPIPKIDNSGKTYITNSKLNTKVNNEKPKRVLTILAQFKPSNQSKMAKSSGAVENIDYISVEGKILPMSDTKKFDGEVPVMLELWGMWSTPSLPLLPDPLWSGVVVPDRVLSLGQIELNCVLMLN